MKKWKEPAAILLGLVLFVTLTYGGAKVLLPVRTVFGAGWDSYCQEEKDSVDVLYFGSSIVYCDVIPAVVWKESGLTSYVMAGPEQTMPITYHYLRQACKTQSPQAVVVELNSLFFEPYPDLGKPNLLYMPWGRERIMATLAGADREDWMEMFFPLYSLHDQVYTVTADQVRDRLYPAPDDHAGYTLLTGTVSLHERVDSSFDADTEAYRENVAYLRRIAEFCGAEGIKLVVYFAPIYTNIPQAAMDAMYADVADIPNAEFFDCNKEPWPQFDPMTQWFDCLHLNLRGAVPFSQRLAWKLSSLGLETEHSGHDALWQERFGLILDKLTEFGLTY